MVARATINYCQSINDEVAAFTRQALDIANIEQVMETFAREKPDTVINCAAYTDVDGAETHKETAYAANSIGVENLALAAKKFDSAFVTISTDYVFDGAKEDFYTQRDTPNPQSVYGKSKLEGETRARDAYARSIIVRSGWIYGAGGTNFLSVMHKLLAERKRIKTIGDAYGTPTFAGDLAKRLRELAALDMPCIFHVSNSGDGTTYEGFARKVCEIQGIDKDLIEGVSGNTLSRPARRRKARNSAVFSAKNLGFLLYNIGRKPSKNF
jgi:dTDP-4-dehydrorhamnose reductase